MERGRLVVGGLVLDCFAGSATSGIATLETRCRFVGFESSEAIAAIGEWRLEYAAVNERSGMRIESPPDSGSIGC